MYFCIQKKNNCFCVPVHRNHIFAAFTSDFFTPEGPESRHMSAQRCARLNLLCGDSHHQEDQPDCLYFLLLSRPIAVLVYISLDKAMLPAADMQGTVRVRLAVAHYHWEGPCIERAAHGFKINSALRVLGSSAASYLSPLSPLPVCNG